jgi:subtilase family serine protease
MRVLTFSAALLAGSALVASAAAVAQTQFNANAITRPDVTDLGPAPASTQVKLAFTLNYRDKAALDDLVVQQGLPGSPQYHQFLTPAQFAARFGPTQGDHDQVVAALQRAGFTIVGTYSNRTVIDAAAAAGVVGAYFHTQIHQVSQAAHGLRYANATPAVLPAEIAANVSTVLGLDNVVKVRTHNKAALYYIDAMRQPDAAPAGSVAAEPIERIVGGHFAGIYPNGLSIAYDFPAQHGFTGGDKNLAIVIDSDIANSDLTTFWTAAGVTRKGSITRVLVNGINPGVNGDSPETAIDTETTSSLAPAANIFLYLTSSLADAPIEDAYNKAVDGNGVGVVSSSFGGCELADTPFASATDAIAEQGAALGITFTASTGDAGGYCEDETAGGKLFYSPDIVSTPASGPHFLAIGGTKLTINATTGARVSESAWGPGGSSGGGGGGVSSFWAKPSYQTGVTGIAVVPTITVTSPDFQPNSGFAGRNLPDISLDAANTTGSYIAVYVTLEGGWTGYGGTSVSNPVFAALITEQNQKNGGRSGLVNPALYATFTNNGAKPAGVYGVDFYDITSGSIGAGWTAKAGYDQTTGIGSILGGAF